MKEEAPITCPECGHVFEHTEVCTLAAALGRRGGQVSRRQLSPEQQQLLHDARKKARDARKKGTK